MVNIGICDDKKECRDIIKQYLEDILREFKDINIKEFESGDELVEKYNNRDEIDILFLDIIMKNKDGIQTAKIIRDNGFKGIIIFITLTSAFAIDGYSVDAFRYILKPINYEKLKEITLLAIEKNEVDHNHEFIVKNKDGIQKIKCDNILYFESNLKSIKIVTKTKSTIFKGSMKDIELELSKCNFIRIHKSFIVNLKNIKSITSTYLIVENGDKLWISKHKSKEVKLSFMNYVEKYI